MVTLISPNIKYRSYLITVGDLLVCNLSWSFLSFFVSLSLFASQAGPVCNPRDGTSVV